MKYILHFFLLIIASSAFAQTSWTPVSPNAFPTNASGQIHGISRISQVKFHPTSSTKMYAVSSRGGLFITTNSGTTWTLAPGCDVMPKMRLNSVCVDHTNDQIIYLGTGDANYYYTGSGVYKTTNGGTSFASSGLSGRLVVEILMDPSNASVLVAATDQGIYKSTNGGSSWTLKTSNALACRDMVFKAKTGTRTIFTTTYSELFRSTDMGETWTQLTNGIYFPSGSSDGGGCRVAVTPADSNRIYFAMIAKNGTIFRSTDGGNSFVNMKDNTMPNLTAYDNTSTSTGQGDYNFMFNADPVNGNTLYLGAHNFWKSTDGGSNWTQMTNWYAKLHTDMHWVKVNPYSTSQIWTANDGGVWMSTDGGSNWTPKSDGIYGYEIYHGACSPTRRDMFSIGTQDNGELYHSSGTWYTNRGGDWGSPCAFDYRANSSMVYYLDRNTRRLVNGGDASYGLPVSSLQAIAFYRANPNLGFIANQDVYKTTNLQAGVPAWTKISNFNQQIRALHVNLADSNRVYAITNNNIIYVCNNALSGSPAFTAYSLPNSTSNNAAITSVKSAPGVLYAVLNTRVYRSGDNGVTWSDVSYNLPSVNWVNIIPDEYFSSNELMFVAGNSSVYYRKAGQTSWTLYSTSLPTRTTINDFSVFDNGTNQSVLRVSEYGRGMWEASLAALRTVTSDFAVSSTAPCPGTSVQFSDVSAGPVTSWSWTFPGGTPSTSTLQNPTVTYNTPGAYDVTLVVSDGTNSSTKTRTAFINTNGTALPLTEGFETEAFPPSGWSFYDDSNDGTNWLLTGSAGGFGASESSAWFNNYAVNVAQRKDELRTSRFDLIGLSSATLTFEVAYQPYNTTNYSDTLQVLVSTNCGASFSSVYLKGGGTLSTVAGTNTDPFVPTPSQWRTETVNLNSYIAGGTVMIAFRNVGHYGNNIYIDNVMLTGTINANAGVDKIVCLGSNTAIGSTPVSGISYSWTPSAGLSSTTISNPLAAPTTNAIYFLAATKNGTPIIGRDTVIVTVDAVPITANVTDVLCNGGNNGVIDQSIPPGSLTPYTYLWNNNSVTQDRSGLIAGNYSVIVTDAASCTRAYNYTIAQPADLTTGITTNQSSCGSANGSATVIASGGTAPYTFLWSNSVTATTNSNLLPGVYTVTVTDSKSCIKTAEATITERPLPVINTFAAVPPTACNGDPVTLNISASGGGGAGATTSFASGTINLAIPDNLPTGVSSTIPINSGIILTSADKLTVTLNFGTTSVAPDREHGFLGDVKVTLTSPGGNTVVFDRLGVPVGISGSSADLNGTYTFKTTASDILPAQATSSAVVGGNVVSGNYRPSNSANPDAAHDWSGLSFPFSVDGNWTLTVSDNRAPSEGDLKSWSLSFTTAYTYMISGSTVPGPLNCLNGDCSNASVSLGGNLTGNPSYTVVATAPDGCTASASTNVVTMCDSSLLLRVFIQGFYLGNGTMAASIDPVLYPSLCDTVTIELHDAIAPFDIAYSKKGTIDINGFGNFELTSVDLTKDYYIAIHHRNSIETWSKNPVDFANITNYDFTTASTQAYDDGFSLPMKLVDTNPNRWAMFNGDINLDGGVDGLDMTLEENASNEGFFGYGSTDLTGDGASDSIDMTVIEGNSNAGVFEAHP